MATDVDIRAKLTLDSNASKNLQKVKGDFKEVGTVAKSTASNVADFAKQTAAVALGTHLPAMLGKAKDLATSFLDTADAAFDQQQAMAGSLAIMQQLPWAEARKEAEGLHSELRGIAIDMGQDFGEVQEGFQILLNSLGASKDQLMKNKDIIGDLTVLSNMMGFNVRDSAAEFEKMVTSGASAESQFVKLIAQTGIFGDDMRVGVETFNKMKPAEKAAEATRALKMITDKLRGAEPTYSDLSASIGNSIDLFKEMIGAPIVRQLIPVLKEWSEKMKAAGPAIESLAKALGKDVGKWVGDAAEEIEKGFRYIQTHGEEIKQDLREAAAFVKDAFVLAYDAAKLFIDNKQLFLTIAAGFKGAQLMGGAQGLAKMGGGGAMGGAKGFGAFSLAVAGFSLAVDQFSKAQAEGAFTSEAAKNFAAIADRIEQMKGAAERGETGLAPMTEAEHKREAELRASFVEAAAGAGENARAAGELFDSMVAVRQKTRDILIPTEQSIAALDKFRANVDKVPGYLYSEQDDMIMAALTQKIQDSFNAAHNAQHAGAMRQIGALLSGSAQAQEAFLVSGNLTAEGFRALAANITEDAANFKKQLEDLAAVMEEGAKVDVEKFKKRAAGGGAGSININKMEIKQEFRDQDPDRVAIVFQRDLVKQAIRRKQSKRANPFGL